MRRPALIALMLCLAAFSTVVQAVRPDVQKRFALSAQAFPDQSKTLYIDVRQRETASATRLCGHSLERLNGCIS